MISLEQVKLLETKVARAIEYVERVTGESAALRTKLDSYQKRIDELEVLVMRFKEDQGRIEDGILAALDRLNQFESAVEKSIRENAVRNTGLKSSDAVKPAAPKAPAPQPAAVIQPESPAPAEVFFEIPETETEDDIADPLEESDIPAGPEKGPGSNTETGELDIF